MKITLKDGSSKEYSEAKSVYDIAKDISEGLARVACAGEVDGKVVDLRTVLDKDCTVNIITANDEAALPVIRHTASHVLAQAVKNLYPDAKITIGPAIDDGFYYDFDSQPFSREDLDAIEAEMKKIIKAGHEITRFTLPREEAIKFMQEKGEPYKVELIEDLPEGEEISFYDQGGFVDLCAGPHLMSTKGVKAFKLTSSSMAYWRGDSNKARLHRIYGTAYNKKEELKAHLERMEEAKKRDHNKLGREMGLFTTVDVIGQGLPLMMPKGTKMIMKLQRWIEDLEDNEWGYVRTKTPLMAKSDLYKISGHWDHYLDGMFVLGDPQKDGEEEVMALRPMTCPFQYYVYKAQQHSYRDLPYRMGETSTLFRNEDSGEMHGLTRVRQFTISEGHNVIRPDQCEEELKACFSLNRYILKILGLENDVTYRLSKWDPKNTDKYLGDDEYWNSTQAIKSCLRMNPKWIMLSEARSKEVKYLLESWSTGVRGMTTLHTDDVRNIPDRILNMLESRIDAERMENDIYQALDVGILIRKGRRDDGAVYRYIDQVCFFFRENYSNEIFMVVSDGKIVTKDLPKIILRRFKRAGIDDPFELKASKEVEQ